MMIYFYFQFFNFNIFNLELKIWLNWNKIFRKFNFVAINIYNLNIIKINFNFAYNKIDLIIISQT